MKRLKRNPAKFETLDLYRSVARKEGYTFSDPDSVRKFFELLEKEFEKAKRNPITLHGIRVQTMFEYVAVSLGKCAVIKSEDAGEIYANNDNLEVPDFRILLLDGQEFLVEVKSFKQDKPNKPYVLLGNYFQGLTNYATLFRKEIKIAIFWVSWGVWTLTPLSAFSRKGSKYLITVEDAMISNEMHLLGDLMIATTPPLQLRFKTDPGKPRTVDSSGRVIFTIGKVELCCGEIQITKPSETALALYLMMFSKWEMSDGNAVIEEGELIAIEYSAEPVEPVEDQEFQFLGNMSEIVSRQFTLYTAPDGTVESFSPKGEGVAIGITISEEYDSKELPLWRFVVLPHKQDNS